MAAITDLLTQVGAPGTITSLQAPGKAIAATSINIGSATNWPTATAVYFAIRRVDPTTVTTTNPSGLISGTYTEWKGTVSGTVISNLTLVSGTDQVYPAGTNTQVYITVIAARENAIVTWGTTQHTELGAHTGITTDTLAASGNVTIGGTLAVTGQTTLANNDIQANELATSAITLGYAQIVANPANLSTSIAQVAGMTTTVTIPAGGRRVEIAVFIPYVVAGAAQNIGISIWDGVVGSGTKLSESDYTITAANNVAGFHVSAIVTPSPGSKTYNVGGVTSTNAATINAAATYPAYILVKAI